MKGFHIKKEDDYALLLIELNKYLLPIYTIPLPLDQVQSVKESLLKVIPNIELEENKSMKFMEKTPFIRRIKLPGSKKVYFYMEKDLFGIFMRHIKMENELALKPMKERLPEIIKRYRKENYPKGELKILEMHYNNVMIFSDLMNKMVEYAESRH